MSHNQTTLNTPAYTSEIVLALFFHFSLQAAEVATAQEAAGKNVGHIYKQVLKIKKINIFYSNERNSLIVKMNSWTQNRWQI